MIPGFLNVGKNPQNKLFLSHAGGFRPVLQGGPQDGMVTGF
jgi:hypothetical protein